MIKYRGDCVIEFDEETQTTGKSWANIVNTEDFIGFIKRLKDADDGDCSVLRQYSDLTNQWTWKNLDNEELLSMFCTPIIENGWSVVYKCNFCEYSQIIVMEKFTQTIHLFNNYGEYAEAVLLPENFKNKVLND